MPGELKLLRYLSFGFLGIPFVSLMFRSGPDYTFVENLRFGFIAFIASFPFFICIGGAVYLFDSRYRFHGLFVFLSSLFFFAFSLFVLHPVIDSLKLAKASTRLPDTSLKLKFRGDNHETYFAFPDELQSFFDAADEHSVSVTFQGFVKP